MLSSSGGTALGGLDTGLEGPLPGQFYDPGGRNYNFPVNSEVTDIVLLFGVEALVSSVIGELTPTADHSNV